MRITKEQHIFSMSEKHPPVVKLDLPVELTFETLDCFSEQITSENDSLEKLDFDCVNPATGPVYFNNVSAGDSIAVHIMDIRVKSPGKMIATPGFGVLGDMIKETQFLITDIANGEVSFRNIKLPLNPMVGVIGVAPVGKDVNCGTPGDHGGNMDTKDIKPGSTLYLPVQIDGGLLAMGDLHAAMGDGEIMVSGVEVSGEVEVKVTKAENLKIPMPMVKTAEELSFIASEITVDLALEKATKAMASFLCAKSNLTLNEAGMLMSACGNARISQIVDPEKTARFCMPISILVKLEVPTVF